MEVDGFNGKDSSVVTIGLDDRNLKEESVGKMLDLLAVNPTSDSYYYVPLYKRLLGSVEKISDKLKRIQLQIEHNEKSLETYSLSLPQEEGEQVKEDVIEEAFVPLTEGEKAEVSHAVSESNWSRFLVSHENSNIDITGKILQCLRPGAWLNDELTSCKGGYNYQSVRRWTSQRNLRYCLLECDKARYFVDEVKDKSGKHIDVSKWKQEFIEDLPEQQNGFDTGLFMIKYADFYSLVIGFVLNRTTMPYFRLRTVKELLRLRAN